MRYPAVDYVCPADASENSAQAAFDLGDHAAADYAFVDAVLYVLLIEYRNDMLLAFGCRFKNAADIREDDELGSAQCDCNLGGYRVCVDIVALAVLADTDRSDDGNVFVICEHRNDLCVDASDLADIADVDGVALGILGHLLGFDQVAVNAADTNSFCTLAAEDGACRKCRVRRRVR